ncbi:MAG TPA: L,D-transpeptidase family protein [Candidatus Nanopelagicales bacterium]|nr:L,D-transpeptidase family protein [Candidatus Nanopelagicales bacterium]
MPVDPASLVALSDLSARASSEPDPRDRPAATGGQDPVDVAQPFWVDPVPPGPEIGIDLVAASPEPTPADELPGRGARLPEHLAALDLGARRLASTLVPSSLNLGQLRASAQAVRLPDLGTFPTLDATARRRLALLAGSSVAAGLACGLAVPVAAEAAPASTGPSTAPAPGATTKALLASPSPFSGVEGDSAAAGVPASTAEQPPGANGVATQPVAPQRDTAALVAALLAPATSPFGPPETGRTTPSVTSSAPPAPEVVQPTTTVAPSPNGSSAPTAAATSAPAAARPRPTAAPAAPSVSAAALPVRTTSVAVVVVAEPAPPRPGQRPAPVVVSRPAWTPTRPLPARSGTGRRIVYAERTAHLWIVGADGTVLRDYKVTGRADRPRPGTYHVFSKSRTTSNPKEKLRFDLMIRFTHGATGAPIGFHTIPKRDDGTPIQSEKDLGRAIGMGGCVRQSRADAEWLYSWSRVGDTVVVLH